jgi:hypothetical protein
VVAFTLPAVFYLGGAVLATGSRTRRVLVLLPALSALGAPFAIPPEYPLWRAIDALCVVAAVVRGSDLVFLRRTTTARERLVHALLVIDSFTLRRVRPAFAAGSAIRMLSFTALLLVGRAIAFDLAPRLGSEPLRLATRWLGGLVFVYSFTDAVYGSLPLLHNAVGWRLPVVHRDPILSCSVREFWGNRWNRIIGAWLSARFYRPMAKRGAPALGMTLAFVVSAIVHGYIALPALGVVQACVATGFFLVQGAFALVEGPLGVERWPRWAAHVWTVGAMVGTSPLFVEPFLRVVGG